MRSRTSPTTLVTLLLPLALLACEAKKADLDAAKGEAASTTGEQAPESVDGVVIEDKKERASFARHGRVLKRLEALGADAPEEGDMQICAVVLPEAARFRSDARHPKVRERATTLIDKCLDASVRYHLGAVTDAAPGSPSKLRPGMTVKAFHCDEARRVLAKAEGYTPAASLTAKVEAACDLSDEPAPRPPVIDEAVRSHHTPNCDMIERLSVCEVSPKDEKWIMVTKGACNRTTDRYQVDRPCPISDQLGKCAMHTGHVRAYYARGAKPYTLESAKAACEARTGGWFTDGGGEEKPKTP